MFFAKEINAMEALPWKWPIYYGMSYPIHGFDRYKIHPIPFNLIVGLFKRLTFILMKGFKGTYYNKAIKNAAAVALKRVEIKAWDDGYREGSKSTKDNLEELKLRIQKKVSLDAAKSGFKIGYYNGKRNQYLDKENQPTIYDMKLLDKELLEEIAKETAEYVARDNLPFNFNNIDVSHL